MLEIAIPGRPPLRATHLVLDLNGTLTVDGTLLPGVAARLQALRSALTIVLLTADTFGTARVVAETLDATLTVLAPDDGGAQKLAVVQQLGADNVIAIGNGRNDALMLQAAALGIGVVQAEGMASAALAAADVIFTQVNEALEALLNPRRLVATLRP